MGLLEQIVARLMKLLMRRGYLAEEQGMTWLADTDAENPLAPLQAASCAYRIAVGLRAGPVTARKDDAPAADQAAMTKVAGSMAFSGRGGLIQTTFG